MNAPLGSGQLQAHELGERAGDEHDKQAGDEVLESDHLVIEREDVLLE